MKKLLVCLIMALLVAGGVEAKKPRKQKRMKATTTMQSKKTSHPSYTIAEAKSLFHDTSWQRIGDGENIRFHAYSNAPRVTVGVAKYDGEYNSDGSISVTLDGRVSKDRNKTITFWYQNGQLVDNFGRTYKKINVITL